MTGAASWRDGLGRFKPAFPLSLSRSSLVFLDLVVTESMAVGSFLSRVSNSRSRESRKVDVGRVPGARVSLSFSGGLAAVNGSKRFHSSSSGNLAPWLRNQRIKSSAALSFAT